MKKLQKNFGISVLSIFSASIIVQFLYINSPFYDCSGRWNVNVLFVFLIKLNDKDRKWMVLLEEIFLIFGFSTSYKLKAIGGDAMGENRKVAGALPQNPLVWFTEPLVLRN